MFSISLVDFLRHTAVNEISFRKAHAENSGLTHETLASCDTRAIFPSWPPGLLSGTFCLFGILDGLDLPACGKQCYNSLELCLLSLYLGENTFSVR